MKNKKMSFKPVMVIFTCLAMLSLFVQPLYATSIEGDGTSNSGQANTPMEGVISTTNYQTEAVAYTPIYTPDTAPVFNTASVIIPQATPTEVSFNNPTVEQFSPPPNFDPGVINPISYFPTMPTSPDPVIAISGYTPILDLPAANPGPIAMNNPMPVQITSGQDFFPNSLDNPLSYATDLQRFSQSEVRDINARYSPNSLEPLATNDVPYSPYPALALGGSDMAVMAAAVLGSGGIGAEAAIVRRAQPPAGPPAAPPGPPAAPPAPPAPPAPRTIRVPVQVVPAAPDEPTGFFPRLFGRVGQTFNHIINVPGDIYNLSSHVLPLPALSSRTTTAPNSVVGRLATPILSLRSQEIPMGIWRGVNAAVPVESIFGVRTPIVSYRDSLVGHVEHEVVRPVITSLPNTTEAVAGAFLFVNPAVGGAVYAGGALIYALTSPATPQPVTVGTVVMNRPPNPYHIASAVVSPEGVLRVTVESPVLPNLAAARAGRPNLAVYSPFIRAGGVQRSPPAYIEMPRGRWRASYTFEPL